MRKALCLIFFLVFASSSWGAQNTPAVPELPRLSLDNFSPGIQEQIGEAYSYVRSHPGDGRERTVRYGSSDIRLVTRSSRVLSARRATRTQRSSVGLLSGSC